MAGSVSELSGSEVHGIYKRIISNLGSQGIEAYGKVRSKVDPSVTRGLEHAVGGNILTKKKELGNELNSPNRSRGGVIFPLKPPDKFECAFLDGKWDFTAQTISSCDSQLFLYLVHKPTCDTDIWCVRYEFGSGRHNFWHAQWTPMKYPENDPRVAGSIGNGVAWDSDPAFPLCAKNVLELLACMMWSLRGSDRYFYSCIRSAIERGKGLRVGFVVPEHLQSRGREHTGDG